QGQAVPVREPEAVEVVRDDRGGARLLEAQLGVAVDVVRDADELLPPPVDGGADGGFQGVQRCGGRGRGGDGHGGWLIVAHRRRRRAGGTAGAPESRARRGRE